MLIALDVEDLFSLEESRVDLPVVDEADASSNTAENSENRYSDDSDVKVVLQSLSLHLYHQSRILGFI